MNKKGFTIIEVILSVLLVTIILISMTGTLLKLREVYSVINEDTDIMIYNSSITRIINNDVIVNRGVSSITCTTNKSCDLTFTSGKTRNLSIVGPNDIVNNILNDNNVVVGSNKTITRTLKYIDTTNSSNKLLLMKSLTSKTKEITSGIISQETTGYNFESITSSANMYTNKSNSSKNDIIRKITINMTDNKYDVYIYSYTIE